MGDSYQVKIDHFEGPFDLLLFFIERDELNIYDIDISKITDDFLAYIRRLEELNIDVASEFILVAATLMRIKARMLLPRKQLDEEGNEIDPRQEIIQKLLEYKKYKSILEEMKALEQNRRQIHKRGNTINDLREIGNKALVDVELESITLYKLMKVFQKCMDKYENRQNRTKHTIVKFEYTVENQRTYIYDRIKGQSKMAFTTLFEGLENRIHAIVTFLALLDMLNSQTITVLQGEGMNNFWITDLQAA